MIMIREVFMFVLFTWVFIFDISMLHKAIQDKKEGLQMIYEIAAAGALACAIIWGSGAAYLHIQTVDAEIRKVE